MAKGTENDGSKNRGGRRKGAWTLTTPDAIRDFRRIGRISRSRLAGALGVSATSVQNWEVGLVVATTSMQSKLVDLMKSSPPDLARLPRPTAQGAGDEVEAAGQIVCAWLLSHPGTKEEELLALIRAVRTALM